MDACLVELRAFDEAILCIYRRLWEAMFLPKYSNSLKAPLENYPEFQESYEVVIVTCISSNTRIPT